MTAPYTPTQWATIQKNAAARLATDPENPKLLKALHDSYAALRTPETPDQPEPPGVLGSAAVGFGQGAGSGLTAAVGDQLPGPSNSQYLSAARSAHPWVTGGADLAGNAALGVLLSRLPGIRAMTGAGQGLTLGGAMGAARGAGESSPDTRLLGATIGGTLGAAGGYAAGKVADWAAPNIQALIGDLTKTKAPLVPHPDADPFPPVGGMEAQLQRIQAARDFVAKRAEGLPAPNALEMPTAIRRGTIMQNPIDQRYTSQPNVANSYKELQELLRRGIPKDQIRINYWTRGGAAEQTVPPVPQSGSLNHASYADLRASLPTATGPLKEAILKELQRRGIMGKGLLGAR